jgi:hypothetical protein
MAAPLPTFGFAGRRIAVDIPHLAFATGIVAWAVWFCRDAWRSARDVENLIMIVPASIAAVAFYIVVAAGCFHILDLAAPPVESPRRPLDRRLGLKIAGTMAMLAAFVVAGPLIGFDVASFAYVLAMLFFLGERRVLVLLLVPAVFCAVAIYSFDTILATPLPLLLVPGDSS